MRKREKNMIPMTTKVIKREKDHANDEEGEEKGVRDHASDEEDEEKREKDHANDEEDEEKREPTESPHRPGPHPLLQGNNTLESFVGNLRHKYYAVILINILFYQLCFDDFLSGLGSTHVAY